MTNADELFKDAVEHLKGGVAAVTEAFTAPDDDYLPVAHLLTEDRSYIMPMQFRNDAEKDYMAEAVAGAATEFDAKVVGFVMSAWTVAIPMEDYGKPMPVRPSQHADRREVVILSVISARKQMTYAADIKRDGVNPPTLGEWGEGMDGGSGRFIESTVMALLRNDITPNKGRKKARLS